MPGKNDEEHVTVTQTLTEKDVISAAAAVKYFASPMRRRSIRTAVCLTVAVLAASTIPASLNFFGTAWIPITVASIAAAAAALIWFLQPVLEARRAEQWFRSCPLAAQPSKVTVFRDHVVLESEYEKITEYWTDFTLCAETKDIIAAGCGTERALLVVKKQGLSKEEAEQLSSFFRYAFEVRYFKISGKGGT